MGRLKGLDSIRFFAAFIVFLSHGAMFRFSKQSVSSNELVHLLDRLRSFVLPNGPAAVTVFFVISGFVIHYPFIDGKVLSIPQFYIQRILRIALPLIGAYLLYYLISISLDADWSIHCEIFYYLCYPVILYFRKNLNKILFVSIIISYLIAIYHYCTNSYDGDMWVFGASLTWIVCYPLWLTGAVLAENFYKKNHSWPLVTARQIFIYRVVVYLVASALVILRFHMRAPYYFSMPIFAFLVYQWLKKELIFYNAPGKEEGKLFSFLGLFSYSMYLMAGATKFALVRFFGLRFNENIFLCILAYFSFVIVGYVFYKLIEHPGHRLARAIKINGFSLNINVNSKSRKLEP